MSGMRQDQGGLGSPVQMMGLAESTHKLYACGVHRFTGICSAAGLAAVPASEETLCHFAATLTGRSSPTWPEFGTCISQRGMGTPSPPVSTGCTMSCVVSSVQRGWLA